MKLSKAARGLAAAVPLLMTACSDNQQHRAACEVGCQLEFDQCEKERCGRLPETSLNQPPGYPACHLVICDPANQSCRERCRSQFPKRWWEFWRKD